VDRRSAIVVVAVLLVPLGVTGKGVAFSLADEFREPSYGQQVEPICKWLYEEIGDAVDHHMVGKPYPPARASAILKRSGRAPLRAYRMFVAVEAPAEFKTPVSEWLLFVKRTASRYLEAGRALALGREATARHLLLGLEVPPPVERTEDALHFAYCKINPRIGVVPFSRSEG
jgi:hypothetical protein